VSVGYEDGTVEVFRSSRPERVWDHKPDTRYVFRVTLEKDNDEYMLIASDGWRQDKAWQPSDTSNSEIYIYRREPIKCDLKSHTLGYESAD
jgi:hypothetical protein